MRILITTDSVKQSDTAVRLGSLIHKMTGGSLTILTTIKSEAKRPTAETSIAQAKKLLDTTEDLVTTHIRSGQPVDGIVEEALGGEYDLVILDGRARNRIFGRFQAPIAEQIVARISCPLILARGRARPFRRILVCDSGHFPSLINDLSLKMQPLLKQAEQVTVLHVMSQIAAGPGVPGWELRADAEELIQEKTPEGILLEEGMARLEQLNIQLEAKVRHGLVVREILDEAQSGDFDLVVIGAHSESGWEHLLLDDLAREIIRQIDRPLLVIKR